MHRKLKLLFSIKRPQVRVVLTCTVIQAGLTSQEVISVKSQNL